MKHLTPRQKSELEVLTFTMTPHRDQVYRRALIMTRSVMVFEFLCAAYFISYLWDIRTKEFSWSWALYAVGMMVVWGNGCYYTICNYRRSKKDYENFIRMGS